MLALVHLFIEMQETVVKLKSVFLKTSQQLLAKLLWPKTVLITVIKRMKIIIKKENLVQTYRRLKSIIETIIEV